MIEIIYYIIIQSYIYMKSEYVVSYTHSSLVKGLACETNEHAQADLLVRGLLNLALRSNMIAFNIFPNKNTKTGKCHLPYFT